MKDYLNISPGQITGKEIIAEHSIGCNDENEAIKYFNEAKTRLLDVNNWHTLAGWTSAQFQAFDENGNKADRPIQQGYYMRVDIPGPGSTEGHGYDWVKIEALKERRDGNIQAVGFRVRPASHPREAPGEVAHFYDRESTSSFIVTREDQRLTALIIDRNIKPNDDSGSISGTLRDTSVAIFAMNVFSKIQWQHLANGLLKNLE